MNFHWKHIKDYKSKAQKHHEQASQDDRVPKAQREAFNPFLDKKQFHGCIKWTKGVSRSVVSTEDNLTPNS